VEKKTDESADFDPCFAPDPSELEQETPSTEG